MVLSMVLRPTLTWPSSLPTIQLGATETFFAAHKLALVSESVRCCAETGRRNNNVRKKGPVTRLVRRNTERSVALNSFDIRNCVLANSIPGWCEFPQLCNTFGSLVGCSHFCLIDFNETLSCPTVLLLCHNGLRRSSAHDPSKARACSHSFLRDSSVTETNERCEVVCRCMANVPSISSQMSACKKNQQKSQGNGHLFLIHLRSSGHLSNSTGDERTSRTSL